MLGMFMGCNNLRSIQLPTPESGYHFGDLSQDLSRIFSYCKQLSSIPISGNFGESAVNLSNAFDYCLNLSELTLNADTTTFGQNAKNINGAFQ